MATHTHSNGVGARLRASREAVGLTQRDLACEGVSNAYISRVEAGLRTASVDVLVTLAAQLRAAGAEPMSALYLLTGEHDSPCLVCGRQEPQRRRKRVNH